MTHKTAYTMCRTLATVFIALVLGTAWAQRPYDCNTDTEYGAPAPSVPEAGAPAPSATECEAQDAARCWILCEA